LVRSWHSSSHRARCAWGAAISIGTLRNRARPALRVRWNDAGKGAPLLLLHSINAAGSAREVRPAFEHAQRSRRVYAPDLPGYGFSDRSSRRYDIPLFCNAIRDMLAVIAADHGKQRVDLPVWLAHGTRGDFSDFSEAGWLRARPNWSVQPFETGALVYFEQPAMFFRSWDAFLSRAQSVG